MLNLLSGHEFVIRAPTHEWLLKYVDKNTPRGCKEIELWGHEVMLYWKRHREDNQKYVLLVTNTNRKRIWWMYGHHKQMIEKYHDDLKNKLEIRKLPSGKFYAILVYFCLTLLIYMLARAVLLGIGMNGLSCGTLLFVISISTSRKSLIENLLKLNKRKRIRRELK